MYYYRILLFSFFTLLALSFKLNHNAEPGSSGKVQYTAYYFHPTPRCQSCLNLESFTKELIETKFSKTPVVFKSINIDEEENEHYKQDFGLEFSSLISC